MLVSSPARKWRIFRWELWRSTDGRYVIAPISGHDRLAVNHFIEEGTRVAVALDFLERANADQTSSSQEAHHATA